MAINVNRFPNNTSSSFKWIVVIGFLTAIGGEIKIYPFDETAFRFGFGSIVFFLCALLKPIPIMAAGVSASSLTLILRTFIDYYFNDVSFLFGLKEHFPAASFYLLFALCLHLLKIQQFRENPFKLGLLVATSEVISNLGEQFIRFLLQTHTFLYMHDFFILITVALLRSFFVVGIYSSIVIAEQKKRVQEMLNTNSGLYVETLYLKKSMNQIETITADSFDLYQQLKTQGNHTASMKALHIAQEIHEVKKDSQRIYAGISKIIGKKDYGTFQLSDLLHYVEEANKKYSEMLGKEIQFTISSEVDFQTKEPIALLALLNNITANAVEAIEEIGAIEMEITQNQDHINITIIDNGKGIPQDLLSIIFEPGFTTKYNTKGVSATGIGLSHVQELLSKLEGVISIQSVPGKTMFNINIPTQTIQIGEK